MNHDKDNAEQRGDIYQLAGSSNYLLSYEKKRAILKNNIFGVDIDPLAVEVSKFSLLLKVLENSSLEEVEAFHQRTHQRILPNLDENIKNGNSLVDMSYARFDRSIYQNISLMNKLKLFDWDGSLATESLMLSSVIRRIFVCRTWCIILVKSMIFIRVIFLLT